MTSPAGLIVGAAALVAVTSAEAQLASVAASAVMAESVAVGGSIAKASVGCNQKNSGHLFAVVAALAG